MSATTYIARTVHQQSDRATYLMVRGSDNSLKLYVPIQFRSDADEALLQYGWGKVGDWADGNVTVVPAP